MIRKAYFHEKSAANTPLFIAVLIHMNGRIYDPQLGRMLQADPFIQSPTNTQSFNRYTYALNNPHRYTDPSGYFFKEIIDVVVVVAAVYMEVQCGGCGAGFQMANTWFASGARVAVGIAENAFTAFAGGNYLEGTLAIGKGIVCNGPTAMDCPATEGLDQLAQLGDGLIQQSRGGGNSRTAAQIAEGTYAPWTGPKFMSGVGSPTWQMAGSNQRESAQKMHRQKFIDENFPDGSYGSCRSIKECYAYYVYGNEAQTNAIQTAYPSSLSASGNVVDAYRHAYWAYRLSDSVGVEAAKRMLNGHEYENLTVDMSPIPDSIMDMHNNSVGVELGQSNPGLDSSALEKLIKANISKDKLMTSPPRQ